MKVVTTKTLIIGAGPAGLAAAMELSRAGEDFLVVEKQDTVGGLARTYTFVEDDGSVFHTDNGPHRFFSKNRYLYDFIEDLIDEQWIVVDRQTRQLIDGKFYDYPVNPAQALRNLGPARSVRILVDYVRAKITYGLLRRPLTTFDDYVVANFGRTLGEFNMINYTEKIWGIPARTIHPDWAGQRIKGLSLTSLVREALGRTFRRRGAAAGGTPKSLVDRFYYPELGTGLIYDTIVERIRARGHEVLLSTEPLVVRHDGSRVTEVVLQTPDGPVLVRPENLVESVPLQDFVRLLEPEAPQAVRTANDRLTYRSQVYLFLTLDKPSVTTDQWIYFPSRETPIARVSEMRNFSARLSPEGKTSLFIEFFCTEGDELWETDEDALLELTLSHFEGLGLLERHEVRRHHLLRQRNVYPVYDLDYTGRLEVVKGWLDSLTNLHYIGRPGRFRYNNQDHSLEMGILTAKSIVEGRRYDIEKVGSESEYFEAGNLHAKEAGRATSAGAGRGV
ncbi:Protoporphyrinogen oxidase [Microlunatus sagamiharensis]|uniref:Protoporphyrinogen oxidase n=1 Tax=Microlunatus sagamiharensis TaxID=546874 RepID=A0A1H2N8G5_9ACTN|nr:FAD-dependent oxidoreductase [Microlunatus sagamiharensis]SDV01760.1 Protoporphyrinogen oxidase [Microlunatus sagamiharensis]